MAVELILLGDVESVGRLGDRVRVADGFARNYLLPRKLAAPVTPGTLRRLEARKLQLQKEHEERVGVAKAMAEKIAKLSVSLTVEAGENDKLYGSVTAAQIAEALAAQGVDVERAAVLLDEPIKELGVYTVEVRLHEEVKTPLKVWVVRA
jgi:large subunit ribosomal protein L9